MDVVALSQFGVGYAAATLGTATTRTQLNRLFRHTDEIIFCFDGDRAGREAAWRALDTALPCLQEGRQIAFLFLPQDEDPDSIVRSEGKKGFETRLHEAKPLPDYLLGHLQTQADLSRIDGRARFVELARPMLKKIPQGAFRELMLSRIAQLAQMERDALDRALPAAALGGRKRVAQLTDTVRKSLVRLGLSLLIQKPELAKDVEDADDLGALELPGIPLLVEVIGLLRRNPGLNSASILERYRDTEHHKHLEKLAVWDHMIPDESLDQEFEAVIQQLRQRWAAQQATRLLHQTSLSAEEKSRLRELLSQRSK